MGSMLNYERVHVALAMIPPMRLHLTQSARFYTIFCFLPPTLFSNILPRVHFALASVASLLLIKHAMHIGYVNREERGHPRRREQHLQSHGS